MSTETQSNDSDTTAERATNGDEYTILRRRATIRASICLVVWVFLFSGGTLVETLPSRIAIGPVTTLASLKGDVLDGVCTFAIPESQKNRFFSANNAFNNGESNKKEAAQRDALISWSGSLGSGQRIWYFGVCMLFYTPINLAFLSFLSGMIGGYFSNFYVLTKKQKGEKIENPERLPFLEEPPLTSAIRGFLAYICFIAGVYIVMSDPFNETSTGQYLKVAGTVTAVAFSFGYDPTKIGQLLSVIPGNSANSTKTKEQ